MTLVTLWYGVPVTDGYSRSCQSSWLTTLSNKVLLQSKTTNMLYKHVILNTIYYMEKMWCVWIYPSPKQTVQAHWNILNIFDNPVYITWPWYDVSCERPFFNPVVDPLPSAQCSRWNSTKFGFLQPAAYRWNPSWSESWMMSWSRWLLRQASSATPIATLTLFRHL